MYKNKKIIAIIPARSGSKGLKDKNIKDLNGKPLIAYTIEAAIESKLFDKVFVSTDSEQYAQISKKCGADVPFLRSAQNSTDKAGTWEVVKEVIDRLGEEYDIITLLQPTSPLRTAQNIKEAMDLFFEKDADTVCSVCETPHPIFWCNTLDNTLSMENFVKKEYQKRRQDLPKSYTLNGAIYICKTQNVDNLDLYSDKSFAYIMNQKDSLDIDDLSDFKITEYFLHQKLCT